MKSRWLGIALLVLAIAVSVAFANRSTGPPAAPSAEPESPEIAALYGLAQRLASETDQMTVGLAQLRLNASAGDAARR